MQTKLSRFLMSYCSIPHSTTGKTLANFFLKQPLITRLDLLTSNFTDKVIQSQENQKRFHDNASTREREFVEGQYVLVENLRGTTPKWISGKNWTTVLQVEINVIHGHHIDQLYTSQ